MKSSALGARRISLRDLIQFFIYMEQMQSAGVPLIDALADIRDSTDSDKFRDVMTEIVRDVSDGSSLSEAMAKHPKIFLQLYISFVEAGEETGDLMASYSYLVKYLKWVDFISAKIRKATRYPIIVTVVVLLVIVFMMSVVVPQIVGFLKFLNLDLPWFSVWLIATSNFFVDPILGIPYFGGVIVLSIPLGIFFLIKFLRKSSERMAYFLDSTYLRMPVVGNLIRKISIARYTQTFGTLYASGIDVISALGAARATVSNLVMLSGMELVERRLREGRALSESFNESGEFPSLVVRMVKVGEESGNLTPVLNQVSEFYTNDVNEAIEAMVEMIQPTLTIILAVMMLWIAAGSLGPIYMNLGNFMK